MMMASKSRSSTARSAASAVWVVARTTFIATRAVAATPMRLKTLTPAWRMRCIRTAPCACRTFSSRRRRPVPHTVAWLPSCSVGTPSTRTAFANCRCHLPACSLCAAQSAAHRFTSMRSSGWRWIGKSRKRPCRRSTKTCGSGSYAMTASRLPRCSSMCWVTSAHVAARTTHGEPSDRGHNSRPGKTGMRARVARGPDGCWPSC
mmetsp:Transcript_176596/g.429563  ORF Transcript_176596/g.429563 Transcript_176596/m.429563 type:complete len:204 (-) Transcript_176596:82-693(-)